MSEQFVRVRAGNGYLTIERGIPTAFCGHSFPIGDDGYIACDDLRDVAKMLKQALDGEEWEGVVIDMASKESDEGELVTDPG